MPDILSQSQIDDLLKRMQGANAAEEPVVVEDPKSKVKEYDFSSPKKFTKDQLTSMTNLYESYSRMVTSYFTSIMRELCEVNVIQIEEQRYYEFSNALSDNTLVAMIDFRPEDRNYDDTVLMLELAQSFGFMIIERLMGAMGDVFMPDRDFSDIELAILGTVLQRVNDYLRDAWRNYLPVNTTFRNIETNGRMIQAFSPQDIVIIVTLEIKCGAYTATSNICMPSNNLDAIITSFGARYAKATKQQSPERERVKKDLVLDYIKQSDLLVEAVLDQCQMSLGEVIGLQVNDVIALGKHIDSDVQVSVDGIPWYNARLGESRMKKAVKLIDAISR